MIALTSAGFGTGLTLFAGSTHLWLSTMLLVPVGFCLMMLPIACSNIVMQTVVPDALRGRGMSRFLMTDAGAALLGALLAEQSPRDLGLQ